MSSRGVVAAGHPLTAEAGARVLREGGNAVDAAVAAVLTARGAPAEPIAAHLLAGEPAGDRENFRILRAAADQAVAAIAPRAAVRYLARALDEGVAEGAERRELLLELGRWQRIVGDVLRGSGYAFTHPDLEGAARWLVA